MAFIECLQLRLAQLAGAAKRFKWQLKIVAHMTKKVVIGRQIYRFTLLPNIILSTLLPVNPQKPAKNSVESVCGESSQKCN